MSTRSWGSYTLDGGSLTIVGGPTTLTDYSGPVPPVDCGGCGLNATRVRILFWPVDDNDISVHNSSGAAAILPYTTVANGFTL